MLGSRNTRDNSGKPIRRALNKYAFATTLLSSATPLFLGYGLAVVYSTAVTLEADLKLLACTVPLSSLLGATVAMGVQRLIGHRSAVLLSGAVLWAGALARVLVASPAALFTAGTFVNGIGTGLALVTVPAYAAKLSPASVRGALASHPDGLLYLGCILGSLCHSSSTGVLINIPRLRATWQVVMTVASCVAGPALLASLALLLPESPPWLVATDQVNDARRVLVRTSASLEEAELRFLQIKDELGLATGSWLTEECTIWLDLLTRPTEPLRRAVVTALVAKLFQQASGIGSLLPYPYVQRAFRHAGVSSTSAQVPRALAAFGFVVVLCLSVSLVLLELGWHLARATLAGFGRLRLSRLAPASHRATHVDGMTQRQEQLKCVRGLSATMLLSLVALAWIAVGPVRWADASSAAAVNGVVSSAILACFLWVYEFSAAGAL